MVVNPTPAPMCSNIVVDGGSCSSGELWCCYTRLQSITMTSVTSYSLIEVWISSMS